jgi:hypothetical protein
MATIRPRKRPQPVMSVYDRKVLREVYYFADPPAEYLVACVTHRVTCRARTLEEAATLLDGTWCGSCRHMP